jgi:hypothetical protein
MKRNIEDKRRFGGRSRWTGAVNLHLLLVEISIFDNLLFFAIFCYCYFVLLNSQITGGSIYTTFELGSSKFLMLGDQAHAHSTDTESNTGRRLMARCFIAKPRLKATLPHTFHLVGFAPTVAVSAISSLESINVSDIE